MTPSPVATAMLPLAPSSRAASAQRAAWTAWSVAARAGQRHHLGAVIEVLVARLVLPGEVGQRLVAAGQLDPGHRGGVAGRAHDDHRDQPLLGLGEAVAIDRRGLGGDRDALELARDRLAVGRSVAPGLGEHAGDQAIERVRYPVAGGAQARRLVEDDLEPDGQRVGAAEG